MIDIGHAAHAVAASSGGPRSDPELTRDQVSAYDNGVWLCPTCATLVDKLPDGYPVRLLIQWQRDAEARCQLEAQYGEQFDVRVDPGTVTRKTRAFLQRVRELRLPGGPVPYPAFLDASLIHRIESLIRECHAMTFDHSLHAQLEVAHAIQVELLRWLLDLLKLLRDPNLFWQTEDGYLHRVGWYQRQSIPRDGDATTDRLNDCMLRIHQLAQDLESFASGGRMRGTW
ncbi:hypothetical protein [Stenotrophomonas sp. GZD-301]|uniref:hypothetical protein n=1 Tax=Stenotrophomonas sp. GZD-301 TaxID=3404814 RepID=UPI003BB5AED9